jgi:hypothetical protein
VLWLPPVKIGIEFSTCGITSALKSFKFFSISDFIFLSKGLNLYWHNSLYLVKEKCITPYFSLSFYEASTHLCFLFILPKKSALAKAT